MENSSCNVKCAFEKFLTKRIHEPPEFIPRYKRVLFGTFAGMVASTLVHPLDLIKVRVMVNPEYTMPGMGRRILRCQGYLVLYTGLSASLLRQATNTMTRLSVYNRLYEHHKRTYKQHPTEEDKVLMGIAAGLAGGFVGNPSEVVLVRMMAASSPRAYNNCSDLRSYINRPYRNCFDGLNRIIVEEGVRALWRGGSLTILRSVLVSTAQIGCYGATRDKLIKYQVAEGYKCHALTTLVSSFVTTVITLPIDIIKTRYQIKRRGVTLYSIFTSLKQARGTLGLWKRGFVPYYFRLVLHTLTSFFINENLMMYYYEHKNQK